MGPNDLATWTDCCKLSDKSEMIGTTGICAFVLLQNLYFLHLGRYHVAGCFFIVGMLNCICIPMTRNLKTDLTCQEVHTFFLFAFVQSSIIIYCGKFDISSLRTSINSNTDCLLCKTEYRHGFVAGRRNLVFMHYAYICIMHVFTQASL